MLGLLIAPAAWTGSEDARHLPDDRAQAELPTSVLPFSLAEFFARYYDRTMLRLNHTQTHFDPEAVWARADFAANLAAIVDDGKARTPGVVKPYAGKGKEKYPLAILTPTLTLTLALTVALTLTVTLTLTLTLGRTLARYQLPDGVNASEAVSLLALTLTLTLTPTLTLTLTLAVTLTLALTLTLTVFLTLTLTRSRCSRRS